MSGTLCSRKTIYFLGYQIEKLTFGWPQAINIQQTDLMKFTRLDFFKALSLLPLAGLSLRSQTSRAAVKVDESRQSRFEPWIEIYPENMRNNVRQLHKAVEHRPIMAVIKNNGYGMGVVNSARILESMDEIEGLAVVKLSEAITLREAGITKPLLLMNLCEGEELEEAVSRDITPMVYTRIGEQFQQLSRKFEKTIPVEVKLDTGLGRIGLRENEAADVYKDLTERSGVKIQGSLITFTEAREFDEDVMQRYIRLTDRLKEQGMDPGRRHVASTTPIFRHPEAYFDMVRPGIGLYGIYPQPDQQREKELMDLKPAFGLKCRVIHVKQLKKGETAGYGQAFEAEENTWMATLPVGHADGWQRSAAGCARVRIKDRLYPVVGTVSASHTLVDLGSETEVAAGDEATIFDDREGSRPDDINIACDTSTYDLTMHLSPSINRIVKE